MTDKKTYISFSPNVFNLWRLIYVLVPFLSIALWFKTRSNNSFLLVLVIVGILCLLITLANFTFISKHKNGFHFISVFKRKKIANIKTVKLWWNYKIGSSYQDSIGMPGGRMYQRGNKINVYARIDSENEQITLYEQIHFSDRFPNDIPYSIEMEVEKRSLFKVWNLRNCLKLLNLDEHTNQPATNT